MALCFCSCCCSHKRLFQQISWPSGELLKLTLLRSATIIDLRWLNTQKKCSIKLKRGVYHPQAWHTMLARILFSWEKKNGKMGKTFNPTRSVSYYRARQQSTKWSFIQPLSNRSYQTFSRTLPPPPHMQYGAVRCDRQKCGELNILACSLENAVILHGSSVLWRWCFSALRYHMPLYDGMIVNNNSQRLLLSLSHTLFVSCLRSLR